MIGNGIVACTGTDDVSAAAAIDRVVAAAGDDGIGAGRSDHVQIRRQRARVEILEARHIDGVADGLVGAGRDGEIDRGDAAGGRQHQRIRAGAAVDRRFGAMIDDGVVAGAGR